MLIGDRIDNLEALKGRQWDVVIDNSGRQVQWTKDTAELLKDNAKLYVYISSDSVYYPYYTLNVKEDQHLVMEIPEDLDEREQVVHAGALSRRQRCRTVERTAPDFFLPNLSWWFGCIGT